MHPIDAILEEYNTTRYAFQKNFGYSKNRFYNLAERNTPVDNLQVDIIHDMSVCFNLTMDEVYGKLKDYEKGQH